MVDALKCVLENSSELMILFILDMFTKTMGFKLYRLFITGTIFLSALNRFGINSPRLDISMDHLLHAAWIV